MPQLLTPKTKIRIVPKEGEIEITLNINITIDGQIVATADKANVVSVESDVIDESDSVPYIMPDFAPVQKINFGKIEGANR